MICGCKSLQIIEGMAVEVSYKAMFLFIVFIHSTKLDGVYPFCVLQNACKAALKKKSQ